MDRPISVLIREKLAAGRLPREHFPRIRSGPGNGETCDGCEAIVARAQMMMGSLDAGGVGFSSTSGVTTCGSSSARYTDNLIGSRFRCRRHAGTELLRRRGENELSGWM